MGPHPFLKFQSLFYWISLCDWTDFRNTYYTYQSFNPCFIGLASATVTTLGLEGDVDMFQSLFYWISLCDREKVRWCYPIRIVSILVLLD